MSNCPYNFGVYLEDHNLLICHPRGELTSDLMNDIINCRDCIREPGALSFNRFHNLTDISSINFGYEEVSLISAEESKIREAVHSVKACYLVPNTLLFGTVRMYESLISRGGVEVHVSYDINELAKILVVEKDVLTTEPIAQP